MTPQAARFLDKAQQLLSEAETMLGVGLNEAGAVQLILPRIMAHKL